MPYSHGAVRRFNDLLSRRQRLNEANLTTVREKAQALAETVVR
jgi:hypothetical protein